MSAMPPDRPASTVGTLPLAPDPLRLAREGILAPAGLDENRIEQALGVVLGSAVDAADLYFQLSREESWALEDGIVKKVTHPSSRAWACGHCRARRRASRIPTRS